MPTYFGLVGIDSPCLVDRKDKKRPSSRTFCDDGDEFRIDSTEMVVMDVFGDGDAIKTMLPVACFAVNVPKL